MIHDVKNVGQIGLAPDVATTELPLNAWTDASNVRFRDGAVEKIRGHGEVYASAIAAPYWMMKILGFWVYGGLTKIGAHDGTNHADVSRTVGGAYAATAAEGWTGTTIEGFAVLNNSIDVPQFWSPSLSNDFAALTNFPASTYCGAMRSLKRYLIALDVTKTATRYPYMVKWSHAAAAGALPSSWDETDEAVDAGEYNLPSEAGYVLDLVSLRDDGAVYTQQNVWRMTYVGGVEIFRFTKLFDTIGAVNKRCAVEFFSGKHIVYTGGDIVLHDGFQANSILDSKAKRSLLTNLDASYYTRAFVTINYPNKEVWTCITEIGYALPNKAIIWNWVHNSITARELPSVPFIASGVIASSSDLWSSSSTTWDADTGTWQDSQPNLSEKRMLIAVPASTKFMLADETQQFDGSSFTAYVERQGLGFPLKKDSPPDFTTEKLLRGIWPRITGTTGGVVNVSVGYQDQIGGTVTWTDTLAYTIGTSNFLDTLTPGRLHALKFWSDSNISWTLSGYEVDVVSIGSRSG